MWVGRGKGGERVPGVKYLVQSRCNKPLDRWPSSSTDHQSSLPATHPGPHPAWIGSVLANVNKASVGDLPYGMNVVGIHGRLTMEA